MYRLADTQQAQLQKATKLNYQETDFSIVPLSRNNKY